MIQTKALIECLKTNWLGSHLVELDKIDSTNSYAKIHANELHHGSIVLAHEQLKGRGQAQKHWFSTGQCNIHVSIYLKPSREESLNLLTFIPALSILTVLQAMGFRGLSIKWPNDLLVHNKKLAGVLTDNIYQGSRLQSTILGIGWNINEVNFPMELSEVATSLALQRESHEQSLVEENLSRFLNQSSKFTDEPTASNEQKAVKKRHDVSEAKTWSKTQLLVDFLTHFKRYYEIWEQNPVSLARQINQYLVGHGKWVKLISMHHPSSKEEWVRCLGLDAHGFLQVLDNEMEVNTFTYEQIRIQPE